MCSYLHVDKIIWFRFAVSQHLPLSLVSSCRSLVRVFALIDISVSPLLTVKPIDKTTESIIIFHVAHSLHKSPAILTQYQLGPHPWFHPAGIVKAVRLLFHSLLYTRFGTTSPSSNVWARVSNCPLFMCAYKARPWALLIITVIRRLYCWYHTSISFRPSPYLLSGSTFKFVL